MESRLSQPMSFRFLAPLGISLITSSLLISSLFACLFLSFGVSPEVSISCVVVLSLSAALHPSCLLHAFISPSFSSPSLAYLSVKPPHTVREQAHSY